MIARQISSLAKYPQRQRKRETVSRFERALLQTQLPAFPFSLNLARAPPRRARGAPTRGLPFRWSADLRPADLRPSLQPSMRTHSPRPPQPKALELQCTRTAAAITVAHAAEVAPRTPRFASPYHPSTWTLGGCST